jgi:hypothetical protein
MPIGFPSTPTTGQQWPTVSPVWEWDGTKWRALSTGGIAATPITDTLTTLAGSDNLIALRAGVPYLASMAAVQTFVGGVPAATAPAAFTAGQWTATAGTELIELNITALAADGGSAITALQYRLGTGAAVALTGTGTGIRQIAGLTGATAYDVQIRAVNAIGSGEWSDVKTRTPAAAGGGGGGVEYIGQTYTAKTGGSTTVARPVGAGAGDTLVVLFHSDSAADATAALPTGWTEVAVVTPDGLPGRVVTAAGDVADMAFPHASSAGGFLCVAVGGALGASALGGHFWGANPGPDAPTPSITAGAGDTVVSMYIQTGGSASAFGTPTDDYTRQYAKEDAPPMVSVLSRSDVSAGATGTISHGATGGDYLTRWVFTGTFS